MTESNNFQAVIAESFFIHVCYSSNHVNFFFFKGCRELVISAGDFTSITQLYIVNWLDAHSHGI